MATHNHGARIDTHRVLLVDQSCADEGGVERGHWRENQGKTIPRTKREPKRKRTYREALWWLVMQALRAVGFLFAAWAFTCVFNPGARPW